MSDTPQGPGWWQASDDKWYPPPRPAMPGEEPAAAAPGAAPYGGAPAGSPPVAPPVAPPTAPPPGSPAAFGTPPGPPSGGFPAGPPSAPAPGPPIAGAPSPYGMAPAAPPVGEPNRTPLFIVLGILGAAAVVLLIFLIAGGGDDEPEDDPQNPSDRTTQPSSVDPTSPPDTEGPPEPAGEGPLKVVDHGFSNFTDAIDNEPAGSFGFIVENTGDDILQGVDTQVVIYGESDRVITTKDFSIGTIRPGEKLGFGDELYGEDVGSGIERLEIQIPEHADAAVSASDVPEGSFEVADVSTRTDEYNLTTTFTLTSTYSADDVSFPSAYVIYRNAEDEIIGAAWGGADLTDPTVEITTYDPIPDVETTEVYIDPGYIYVS